MARPGHFLFCCLLLLFCAAGARAGDWTIIKYGGRDHVTLKNVADFYGLGTCRRVSNTLTMGAPGRSLRGSIGSNELYINNLKFILSYPIEDVGGEPIVSRMDLTKVIEPVLRPSRIHGAERIDSIVLDPGHGGHDNGATSLWGNEKTYALDVALRARELLEQMGLRVYMTRTDDTFIPLEERVRFANQHPTALFIAIHFNSGGTDASGIETYTLAPRGVPSMAADGPMLSDLRPCPGNVCDSENMALACATHASLICHSQLYDRGIKRARFVVIRDITVPGVLIEGGFLSNPADARRIALPAYRQEEAQCIAIAVRNYRNAVNTPPTLAFGRSVTVRDDATPPPEAVGDTQPHAEVPTVIIGGGSSGGSMGAASPSRGGAAAGSEAEAGDDTQADAAAGPGVGGSSPSLADHAPASSPAPRHAVASAPPRPAAISRQQPPSPFAPAPFALPASFLSADALGVEPPRPAPLLRGAQRPFLSPLPSSLPLSVFTHASSSARAPGTSSLPPAIPPSPVAARPSPAAPARIGGSQFTSHAVLVPLTD